jgi:hypothetical protein
MGCTSCNQSFFSLQCAPRRVNHLQVEGAAMVNTGTGFMAVEQPTYFAIMCDIAQKSAS